MWHCCFLPKLIFVGLLVFSNLNTYGQTTKLDSLTHVYEDKNNSDSIRLDALCEICWEYLLTDINKMEGYLNDLEDLESKVFPKYGYFKVRIVLGYYYKTTGNFDLSFKYFEDALNIIKSKKDTLNLIRAYYRLAELRNTTHNSIRLKQADFTLFHKGLDLLKVYRNDEQTILFQQGMAMALTNVGRYDESMEYLKLCTPIYDTLQFKRKMRSKAFQNYHLGCNYFYLKDYDKAFDAMNSAYQFAKDNNIEDLLIETNYYLGELYFATGDNTKAEKYFIENYKLNNKRGLKWRNEGMKILLEFYEKANMTNKAITLLKPYLALQDSVYEDFSRDKYSEYEVKYKVQEKQYENELLEQNLASQKKRTFLTTIFGALVSLLLFGIILLMIRLRRHTQRLEKSNQYKNQILNVMGHDIRTPLVTQLSIMQDVYERKQEFTSEKMSAIYNLSLSVFKISDNVYNWVKQISQTSVNFRSVTTFNHEFLLILEQYQPVLRMKNLQISHNIDMEANMTIKGDRIGIQAVIRNLIDNAVKYSPNDKTITVTISQQDGKMIVDIKNQYDNGVYHYNYSKNHGLGLQLVNDILIYNDGQLIKNELNDDVYQVIVSFTMV